MADASDATDATDETGRITLYLLFEALTFGLAATVHWGAFGTTYRHFAAGTAETVIFAVLLLGLLASLIRVAWTRAAGILCQGFALLGSCVGLFTIAIGVGPRTTPDVVYHILIIAVLLWGLIVALRS